MRLTRNQIIVFGMLFAGFTVLNFLAGTANEGFMRGMLTAAGTILGPMTGAIARNFQGCCLEFSVKLLPFFGPFVLVAGLCLMQWKREEGAGMKALRSSIWGVAWFSWFFGGIVSFGHALS